MALIGIASSEEKNKNARLRQENKTVSKKIKRRNGSNSLGQHRYMYLSKRSR